MPSPFPGMDLYLEGYLWTVRAHQPNHVTILVTVSAHYGAPHMDKQKALDEISKEIELCEVCKVGKIGVVFLVRATPMLTLYLSVKRRERPRQKPADRLLDAQGNYSAHLFVIFWVLTT